MVLHASAILSVNSSWPFNFPSNIAVINKLLRPCQLYILKALPIEKEPEKEVDLNDFFY